MPEPSDQVAQNEGTEQSVPSPVASEPADPALVARGVAALVEATRKVKQLTKDLENAMRDKMRLQRALPAAFTQAGIGKEFSTAEGARVKRDFVATGSMPKDSLANPTARADAITEAVACGFEGSIKVTVEASFDAGDRAEAMQLYEIMRGYNQAVIAKDEAINPNTLGALALHKFRSDNATLRAGGTVAHSTDFAKLGIRIYDQVRVTKMPNEQEQADADE